MKRAKITFFMIAYNEEASIAQAVQSVLDQTEPQVELYVRSNGSTDRTGEVVRAISRRDSRVHLVENRVNWWRDEAGRIPFTNENGAVDIWPVNRETLGEYVSFLDADDKLQPTFAEEMLRQAQKTKAEITVCGNVFMQDGKTPVGERLPPPLQLHRGAEWKTALQNADAFAQLYNAFRTYWGKLFQRDFFLRHYDEAWQVIGSRRYGSFLDTVTMLRYLKRCEHLCCVCKPLYLFTMSTATSTYSGSSLNSSVGKAVQSEVLFDVGMSFLQEKGVLTTQNQQFLFQLNWAFCWEAMESLQRVKKAAAADIGRVIVPLNNRIASAYLAQNSAVIWTQIEPLIQAVWDRSGQDLALYLRYPARLLYLKKRMAACPDSELLPILLAGVLCDPENRNLLGKELLQPVAERFAGMKKSMQRQVRMDWTMRHDSLQNWWIEEIGWFEKEDPEAEEAAQRLRDAFEREAYEQASECLSKLGKKSPLNRDGVYYRIQMAEMIGEHELAVVLAASARVLFGLDIEMQNLCWFILSQGRDGD